MKKAKIKNWILWIFFILSVFYSIEYTQPRFSLFQDSHDKAVQTFSVWKNHFLSDDLYYPAKSFDSNLEFFHLTNNLHIQFKEKLVSAFPIQFAYVLAPFLSFLPIDFLPYTSFVFLGIGFLILYKKFNFPLPFLFLIYFTTFLWPLSWEYSELPAIFAFSIYGLIPILRKNSSNQTNILSGMALAWVIVVRLDTLPFLGLFFSAHFFFYLKRNKIQKFGNYFKEYLIFYLSILTFLLVHLSINQWLYGHFLGTRYIANTAGFAASFTDRLLWFRSLLFFSDFKIGFFGYIPLAFFVLIFYWIRICKISDAKKSILVATTGTLLIIPWIAPNDGFNNWGPRFYTILIFPYFYLLKPLLVYFYKKKKKILFLLLITFGLFSFSMGIVGAKIQKTKTNLVKKFVSILNETKPDILVFQDYLNFYTSGIYYFKHTVIVSYTSDSNTNLLEKTKNLYPNQKIAFVAWNPDLFSKEIKDAVNEDKRKSGYRISDWDTNRLENQMQSTTEHFQILDRQNYRVWIGTFYAK
ncbi:hypothetical protein EHQ68_02145 [Leptospira congkakensis]|uniref:Glycosyltransferase RgtA/B/C/D-like domain-containing protein n=1 Tax=Leptospira congkakensis TaxID=2484932 RepID=A0A4Z1AFU1_9LEPT|nr:hypothetical protein [Leptospira congkakensis]TGL90257.1 hypothetical protein EHQ69_09905 [Leptospira congkakensis]TGL91264.1 hypothetical protein EHQ68_02145 [Leptospira congkakensis]TGL98316.1 hypothetical protein EHQ70_01730 [Leptospira congkakensis]